MDDNNRQISNTISSADDCQRAKKRIYVNVNVHGESSDISVSSAGCTNYTPGIRTHSITIYTGSL